MTVPTPGSTPTPTPGPTPTPSYAGVADALRALDGLPERPVHEHVELFDGLHRSLQDALAGLDEV